MARGKKSESKRPIESYQHTGKERMNNPPVGLVTPETDPDAGEKKKSYAYDPHLEPQLQWAGKAEHTSFEVPTVSLHVHERIDPRTIVSAVRKTNGGSDQWSVNGGQLQLFEQERKEPLREAVEFYKHAHDWSNRLVAGDSLLVMNSLLEKEGMAGKVQMIYVDPPYGIKYGSNFQPFVNKRDVKDGKDEDLTAEPELARATHEIRWPNVVRINHVFQPMLVLDWPKVRTLELDAAQTRQVAELAPILDGKPDVTKINRIELERLARESRTQRIIFEVARDVFDQMKTDWRGSREVLLAQLVQIVERFIRSDRIAISPPLFYQDELRRRLIITLNMSRVVQHIWEAIRQENSERLTPVFDRDHPIRSTAEMRAWYTGKPCERTHRSHINVCVYDSTWEASDAFVLDDSDHVSAWVKNDHLVSRF